MLKNKEQNEAVVLDGPSSWNRPEDPPAVKCGVCGSGHATSACPEVAKRISKPKAPKIKAFDLAHLASDGLTSLIDTYLNGGRKTKHNYFSIEGNELIHTAPSELSEPWNQVPPIGVRTVVAIKIGNTFIGNASILPQVGRRCAYGSIQANRSETEIQRRLSSVITMIPFTVFTEAKLDISKLKMIEKAKAETVTRNRETREYRNGKYINVKIKETVHYTGAALFSIGPKCFLFDIDRREIKNGIFNAFLVELAKSAKTITAAYAGLKPTLVVKAERAGNTVLRQGEWFFIPVSKGELGKVMKFKAFHTKTYLRLGPNRPNEASTGVSFNKDGKPKESVERILSLLESEDVEYDKIEDLRLKLESHLSIAETYVTGKISHTGREHKDLKLKTWFRVVPNTSVRSFTIRGDVD